MGKGPGTSPPIPPGHLGIANIVATFNVGCDLDLLNIYSHLRNTEYNPVIFKALFLKLKHPRVTCTMYKSGKMIINGAKTFIDSRRGALVIYKVLKAINVPVCQSIYTVSNIVCYGMLGSPFNLNRFHETHIPGLTTSYNLELFPGMTIRFEGTRAILKMFASGKFFFTGSKTTMEPLALYKLIHPILQNFCRDELPPPSDNILIHQN